MSRRTEPQPIGSWWLTPSPAELRFKARLWQYESDKWGVGCEPSYQCRRCPCIYDPREFDQCPSCAAAEAHWRRMQAAADASRKCGFGLQH